MIWYTRCYKSLEPEIEDFIIAAACLLARYRMYEYFSCNKYLQDQNIQRKSVLSTQNKITARIYAELGFLPKYTACSLDSVRRTMLGLSSKLNELSFWIL